MTASQCMHICGMLELTIKPGGADITALRLQAGDERWSKVLQGHSAIYTGEAVNPKYLSIIERLLGASRDEK